MSWVPKTPSCSIHPTPTPLLFLTRMRRLTITTLWTCSCVRSSGGYFADTFTLPCTGSGTRVGLRTCDSHVREGKKREEQNAYGRTAPMTYLPRDIRCPWRFAVG